MDPAEFEETEAHSSNSLGPGLELLCFLLWGWTGNGAHFIYLDLYDIYNIY
jgi:hypothetical protein